jgi:hypothetical protein
MTQYSLEIRSSGETGKREEEEKEDERILCRESIKVCRHDCASILSSLRRVVNMSRLHRGIYTVIPPSLPILTTP